MLTHASCVVDGEIAAVAKVALLVITVDGCGLNVAVIIETWTTGCRDDDGITMMAWARRNKIMLLSKDGDKLTAIFCRPL